MDNFHIDSDSEFGARTLHRLKEEQVIWLVTIRKDMTPQPSPVWFWWNGESILIFSQPNKSKLYNINNIEKVALHFDSDGEGGDIIIFNGNAWIAKDTPPANEVSGYMNKYRDGLKRINTTPEGFVNSYSMPIRVKITGLRGH